MSEAFKVGCPAPCVRTPQRDEGEPVRYVVVEADTLIPSHRPDSFAPHPAYPPNVQERQYHTQRDEQLKVIAGAQRLDPALVLSDTPTPVDGPPLVTSGKPIVLGGNGRTMILLRAFRDSPGALAAYRAELVRRAPRFGIDPATFVSMKGPILVRVVEALHDGAPRAELAAAVRRFNESLTQVLSPKARAVAEARQMTEETVASLGHLLADNEDKSLRDIMLDRPLDVLRILERDSIVHDRNRAQWIAGAELTDEAKDRVEGMFLGKVLGTAERLASAPPSVLAKVERLAPHLIRVAGINPAYDEIPLVQEAIDTIVSAKRAGMNVRVYASQTSMFGGARHPDVIATAALLDSDTAKVTAGRFALWAARAAHNPRQITMLEAPPTRDEARALLVDGATAPQRPQPVVHAAANEPMKAVANDRTCPRGPARAEWLQRKYKLDGEQLMAWRREGQTYDVIAARLGLSAGTVRRACGYLPPSARAA